MVCLSPDFREIEELFRYEVFKLLKAEGKINDTVNLFSSDRTATRKNAGKTV